MMPPSDEQDWPTTMPDRDARDLALSFVAAVLHGSDGSVALLREVAAEPGAVLQLARLVLALLAADAVADGIELPEALRRLALAVQMKRLDE